MKTSSTGRAFIREAEGERLTTYRCSADVPTIGVGHTGSDVKMGMTITKAQSDALLIADLARFEKAVAAAIKVPLTQNQFDALVSLAFNIGSGAFAKSTLVRLLNGGHYDQVPAQLARWNKLDGRPNEGLTARRVREAALFVKP
jgi:lysozyme